MRILFSDWIEALASNKLLEKGDRKALGQYKIPLALYAVAMMHGCEVVLNHGTKADLTAIPSGGGGEREGISVIASGRMQIALPVFISSASIEDHCATELLGPIIAHPPMGQPIRKPGEWTSR